MIEAEFTHLVYGYFASERQTALTDDTVGMVLVTIAGILWRRSGAATFQRGLAYPLIVVGIFLICACSVYAVVVEQRGVPLVAEYHTKPVQESRALEEARLRKIVNGGYTRAFVIFSLAIAAGAGMFLYSGAPGTKGIACGLIVVGILGFTIEGFSMHKKRQYLETIQLRALGQKNGAD